MLLSFTGPGVPRPPLALMAVAGAAHSAVVSSRAAFVPRCGGATERQACAIDAKNISPRKGNAVLANHIRGADRELSYAGRPLKYTEAKREAARRGQRAASHYERS
jgi:hypothetical protein